MVDHVDKFVPAYKIGSGDITWLELIENLSKRGYIVPINTGEVGRGGHEIVRYSITEPGKSLRQDIGRFIQLGISMEYYPEEFFYLPSD